jgi:hypothetical protein
MIVGKILKTIFMKTFKNKFFSLLFICVGTVIISSCSNDNPTINENSQNLKENSKVSAFLKSFYSNEFEFGKSANITKKSELTATLSKSIEVEDCIITEVFTTNSLQANGYVITDKVTGDFIYFIDVNRLTYKLTSVDITLNNSKIISNINNVESYFDTNEFDFIEIAQQNYNINSINNRTQAPKFWGSSYSQGPCNQTTGLAQLFEDYHVMGIRVQHEPSIGVDGFNVYEPCDMH